ncbi:MAG: HNH endonuclease [Oscillospiraceae bacterium]|jgi:5-methylcytosine-specific restriction protein A|nr:HNH endonuclease [Oscillospiraceae bacterium]
MPYKLKRPCAYPRCPALVHGRFCEAHTKQDNRDYNRYRRDPALNKRYGRVWQKIRAAYLSAHPLCEVCLQSGKHALATLVHHRVPISEGGTHDWRNLQAMCNPCHSAHHARDGSRWQNNRR